MKIKVLTLPILFSALLISLLNACKAPNSSAVDANSSKNIESNIDSEIDISANTKATRPAYNKSQGFFTLEGKIYDANGNEFIARGVNNRHVWFDSWESTPALDALDNIADFGFNSVRIVWEVDHKDGTLTDDALLERIIKKTIDNNMIPVVELHDFTGRNDTGDLLNRGVTWWTERADLWAKYEEYLMINIANEFGDWHLSRGETRKKFPQIYREAITRIRNAGINNTLIIDPFHYGKDYTLITEYGEKIYHHDPQKNVVFSIHFYCGEGTNTRQIAKAFDLVQRKNLPLIVGEFSDTHDPCGEVQDEFIMAESEKRDIGYYAWAWDDQEWKIGTHWEASSKEQLTSWGRDLIYGPNGINETSKTATIFENFAQQEEIEKADNNNSKEF